MLPSNLALSYVAFCSEEGINTNSMRFHVSTAANMKVAVFLDTAPCSHIETGRRFIDSYFLYHRCPDFMAQHLTRRPPSSWHSIDAELWRCLRDFLNFSQIAHCFLFRNDTVRWKIQYFCLAEICIISVTYSTQPLNFWKEVTTLQKCKINTEAVLNLFLNHS
jgi:hypothetical protein